MHDYVYSDANLKVTSYIICLMIIFFRFDELLVGAPMYTNLDPLRVEQGRLYVFFNTGVIIFFLLKGSRNSSN